jgi:hypothetical protein
MVVKGGSCGLRNEGVYGASVSSFFLQNSQRGKVLGSAPMFFSPHPWSPTRDNL